MHIGTDEPLTCRFAVSPMWETQQAVRLLARPGRWGSHLPWLRRTLRTAETLGLEPLWLLMSGRGPAPGFLCPPPDAPVGTFEDELARLRATDPAVARRQLARAVADLPAAHGSAQAAALLADPARAVRTVADATRRGWEVLVAPYWPRLRTLLEADVAFHTRRLAEGGPAALFDGLHPSLSWENGTLTHHRAGNATWPVGEDGHGDGRGLTLMPTVFGWPEVVSGLRPPWPPAVVYPARGIGALWTQAPGRSPEALERLLGVNRAAVLTALAEPASTTALAARLGLAASSVSVHLSTLRAAGLLTSRRVRHQVLYERTPLGIALAAGGEFPAP